MTRKLFALLALAFVLAFVPRLAVADDDAPAAAAPTHVVCAVEGQIANAFPGVLIDACAQSAGEQPVAGANFKPTDEFTVRGHRTDGMKLEIVVAYNGQTLRTTKLLAHSDRIESQGIGMALLFWVFAAASVGGALFVITRKNLIAAVMGMVGSFLGIAAIYMMLYAHFLAVVQMLVYAGAIMVLFVFVIMILNRPEDEPVAPTGRAGQAIGGLAIVYLVGRLVFMLMDVKAPIAAMAAPGATPEGHEWGTVKAVGTDLFNGGLFPFEAISILLLVAVVGAIAIARPLVEKPEADDKDAFTPDGGHA